MNKTRTYLCPDCDGWGMTGGERLDVDDYAPEYSCGTCDETGVITATYAEGEKHGLQPWAGEQGRMAARHRVTASDPLARLAQVRSKPRWSAAFTLDYPGAKRRAMKPTIGRLRMVEAAIRCDVACRDAVQAFRRVA